MEKPAIRGGTPVRDTKLFYGHQYIDEADIQAVGRRCVQDVNDTVTRIAEYYRAD